MVIRTVSLSPKDITVKTPISSTQMIATPEILGIGSDRSSLNSFLSSSRDSIKNTLNHSGVIVFRGFSISGSEDFSDALGALGYPLFDRYVGGVSPRSTVKDKIFVSTKAPEPFIISFHTEFAYQKNKPDFISFFCEVPPSLYGETPIFNCAKMYADIPSPLKEKLDDLGVLYHRKLYSKSSFLNFKKTWKETYYTDNREVIEQELKKEGIQFQWGDDETLITRSHRPSYTVNDMTGEKMLNMTMFNADSFLFNFKRFKKRYNPITYHMLKWLVKNEYKVKNRFFYTTFGDGTPFTKEETETIQRTAWNNAVMFKWRKGDLMLLDNQRWGHGRLNVRNNKERKIRAAMGYYPKAV